MEVMNGLAITLEQDKKFLCVCLFYYVSNFADAWTEVSSSEVLGKITSIQSKLPTAACSGLEKKREETVKPTCFSLLYVESDFGTTDKSFTVFFRPLRR